MAAEVQFFLERGAVTGVGIGVGVGVEVTGVPGVNHGPTGRAVDQNSHIVASAEY